MQGFKRVRVCICAVILVQVMLGILLPFVSVSTAVADSNPVAVVPPEQAPPMPSDTTGNDTLSVGSGGTIGDVSLVGWLLEVVLGVL